MAAQHLVRARGAAGAPVQRLDPQMQREALSRLLRDDWDGTVRVPAACVERCAFRAAAGSHVHGGGAGTG
jgi:hypothetical protein